ncbi:MAG: PAS domain S-box protein [Janthinobacterium lividum]
MVDRIDDTSDLPTRTQREPPGFGPDAGEFLHVVHLAARLARTPMALIASPGGRHLWADPALNLDAAQAETLHELCLQLGGGPGAAIVPDATHDLRLWQEACVDGPPYVRFAACLPLIGSKGENLGVLCVLDIRARDRLLDDDTDALNDLAALAVRMLERQGEADAQQRATRAAARIEKIEAAVNRAQSCEAALSSMLVALCKHHRASAGFVGKIGSVSRVMQEVCHYKDDTGSSDHFVPNTPGSVNAVCSHVATAIQGGTPRTLMFDANDRLAVLPEPASAMRASMRAEIVQPVHLLDDRFGLVLTFKDFHRDLAAIADDVAAIIRSARPALYRKAAERRMTLLGTALDRANDAVVITEAGPLTAAGPKIVYANASFCRESGYTLEDVLGEPHGMLHGRGTDAEAVARLRQEMRRWKPARAELLNYRRDGSEFWAELDLTPITDAAGLPTHWVSIQRDVTPRRRAEEAQRLHEASFRTLFQGNPLPIVVAARDTGAMLEVNDAAVAQYGWSREEFLTKSLADLSPEHEGLDLASTPSVTTHLRGDGSVIEVRAIVHDIVYAGTDATLAVLWDITEHEATRRDMHRTNEMLQDRTRQLHARTEELAAAHSLARLGTWRIGLDRQEVSWSREMYDLMGLTNDGSHLASDALIQRMHPDDREPVRATLAAAAATPGSGRRTFEYRVPLDDDVHHFRAEVRQIYDASGNVLELFGVSQDITERKRAEQALLRNESLRALGQLTGGVAHDFNNLLTVVILNLEEALEVLPPEHELQPVLSPALHAAVRGADLTSQLLSYARRATLRPERVRPDEFFGALRPLLNRVLGERFELQVLLRHNGGSAMVDPAQLDSAIMNLVINARDAMSQGGAIVLETRSVTLRADSPGFQDEVTPGRYVVISVRDRGEGIPAHLLTRVFEPFFTTKAAGKGSGMGLSMVYGFARQSGGHVTIDSTPGQGTTVRLFLPVAEDVAEAPAPEPRDTPEWRAGGLRVLLVEDQESVLTTVTRMLRSMGFDVTPAMSTDDALDSLEQAPPFDLLFTDIVLPGPVDGVALAEEVQARMPSTRILLTSGFTEHSLSAEDVAGVDFLMKPYKRQDLVAKFGTMFPRSYATLNSD